MGISIAYMGKLRSASDVPALVADMRARAEAAGWRYKEMPALLAEGIVKCSGLTGISLYPHKECEPVRLHFDAEGIFANHEYQMLLSSDSKMARMMREALVESMRLTRSVAAKPKKKGAAKAGKTDKAAKKHSGPRVEALVLPEDFGSTSFLEQGRRYNWTKTQFAGPDVHIAVCDLLRHVKERYAPDLEIMDDTGYFASGDRDALLGQFAYSDRIISATANAFQAAAASKDPPSTLDGLLDRVNDELAGERDKLH